MSVARAARSAVRSGARYRRAAHVFMSWGIRCSRFIPDTTGRLAALRREERPLQDDLYGFIPYILTFTFGVAIKSGKDELEIGI